MTDPNPYRPSDSPASEPHETENSGSSGLAKLIWLLSLGAAIMAIALGLLPLAFFAVVVVAVAVAVVNLLRS